MDAQLASVTSKMNSVKEEMATLQEGAESAKKSMKDNARLLALVEDEIRRMKEENAALESRAVSAEKTVETVFRVFAPAVKEFETLFK
jgi:chromosome segregation ATPase